MTESTLDVRTTDGVADCFQYRPQTPAPWPAVLFFMDGLGVRPSLRAMAERLCAHGYYVLLPNMYYRAGAFAPFEPGSVWTNPAERDRLRGIMKNVDAAAAVRDTTAFLDVIAQQPGVLGGRVGCVGYCFGGGLVLRAAGNFPDRVAAGACIHGGNLVNDQPESPHLVAARARGQLYIGGADNDPSYTPQHAATLEATLQAAHVTFSMELYTGASHGFAVGDLPVYNAPAAERHWEKILALFAQCLPRT